ncbi:hypothetical protein PENSPDRAFT_738811 [Peniophora sp. CONT]|nr:hypothetical protein PENSPDRAFT_738811 [Peniophora sp. CONT]
MWSERKTRFGSHGRSKGARGAAQEPLERSFAHHHILFFYSYSSSHSCLLPSPTPVMSSPVSTSSLIRPVLLLAAAHHVVAAPHQRLARRDDGGGNAVRIAVPIVVVVGLAVIALSVRFRTQIGSGFKRLFNNRVVAPATTTTTARAGDGPRELTAAEMTGTAAPVTTRRPRRNRRTPSQMSTTSLPVYAKEAGDHELVIIQGSEELEDDPAAATTTVVMPAVEEGESDSGHSHDPQRARSHSRESSYVNVDSGAHASTPLLSDDENINDNDTHNNAISPITTTAAHAADNSSANLLSSNPQQDGNDPRGEAPPYFEVLDGTDGLQRIDTHDTLPLAPAMTRSSEGDRVSPLRESTTAPAAETVRRRSVFRGLIHALNPLARHEGESHPADTEAQQQEQPNPPRASTSRLSTRQNPTSHRPSQSAGSGSVFSLASSGFHRTTSRVSNAGPLTSPSMLSVHSISSPLTHTAVRTDIVYPRTGPTPEQIKYISSREAVAKFGVPFGADAVAYHHASSSRVNLAEPVPDYEERPSIDSRRSLDTRRSIDGLPSPNSAARESPTLMRPRSHLNMVASADPEAVVSPADVSTSSSAPSMSPDTSLATDTSMATPDTSLESTASEPHDEKDIDDFMPSTPHRKDATISGRSTIGRASIMTVKGHRPESTDGTVTRASTITVRAPKMEAQASSSTTSTTPATPELSPTNPESSSTPTSPTDKHIPAPISVNSTAIPTSTTPAQALAPRKSAPVTSAAPPTAFKAPLSATMPNRPDSRADSINSVATFATAQSQFPQSAVASEFGQLDGPRTDSPAGTMTSTEDEMVSAPSTPRINAASVSA